VPVLLQFSLTGHIDTVTDFSWEPKGDRFAIVSSSDPNLGSAGAGVTIKTDVSFYQLDHSKNDFRLLSTSMKYIAVEP
jgi:translation initiation factor 3 subunit B